MTNLRTVPHDELKARRDSARLCAERPDVFPFAVEARDALDALIWLRERIPADVLHAAVHGEGEGN